MTSSSIYQSVRGATTAQQRLDRDSERLRYVLAEHAKGSYYSETKEMIDLCLSLHGHKAGFTRAADLIHDWRMIR